jgi:hypothetical protein
MIAETGRIGEPVRCQMKTTEDVRIYAAEQGSTGEEALGLKANLKECGDLRQIVTYQFNDQFFAVTR